MGNRVHDTRPGTAGTTASFTVELTIPDGESGCEIESLGCRKIAYVDYVEALDSSDDVDDGRGSNLFHLLDQATDMNKFAANTGNINVGRGIRGSLPDMGRRRVVHFLFGFGPGDTDRGLEQQGGP